MLGDKFSTPLSSKRKNLMKKETVTMSVFIEKRAAICMLMFCLSVSAFAHPVDSISAKAKAVELFRECGIADIELERMGFADRRFAKAKGHNSNGDNAGSYNKDLFYIYNNVKGNGFAVISGNDVLPDVLGYSLTSHTTSENMPDALIAYLTEIGEYASAIEEGEAEPNWKAEEANANDRTNPVEPLMSSQWGQGSPYNTLCPNKWPVGCVATAMAQVMRYWQWPSNGRGSNTYQYGSTFDTRLSVDFSQNNYDWSVMEDKPSMRSSEECKNNVARISYDCGVAVNMEYAASGSGASHWDAMNALVNNFSYRGSKMNVIYREYCATDSEWRNAINNEISEKRPVIFCATSSSGGTADNAHCFVLDGLDDKGYVHVNWGWDGNYDGYFNLDILNPASYKYNMQQRAIIGIMPDKEGNDSKVNQSQMLMDGALTSGWKNRSIGVDFTLTATNIYNYDNKGRTYYMAIGLFNIKNGELVEIISNGAEKSEHFSAWTGVAAKSFTCKFSTEKAYDNRYYVLRFMTKQSGYDTWTLPLAKPGSTNAIYVDIHDGKAYFSSEAPVGIETTSNEVSASSTEYFDLQGRKITSHSKGAIVIKRTTLSDGTVETKKVMK